MPSSPAPADAVIFDLDGTLVDTFPLIVAAWNASVGVRAGRVYGADEVVARFGVPCSAMIRRELPEAVWAGAIEAFHAHYEAAHAMAPAFEGVGEVLATLRGRGVPLGLMTGKGRRSTAITLRALGWESAFASVVTGEDVERQKPAPDGLLRVARELGADPRRCAFVGDSPADIGAGRAAGMTTVAAGWHPVYEARVREMKPDVWARTPGDVMRRLLTIG